MLSNDLCSENRCDEAQSDYPLKLIIDELRKMICDFDLNCDFDCDSELSIETDKRRD